MATWEAPEEGRTRSAARSLGEGRELEGDIAASLPPVREGNTGAIAWTATLNWPSVWAVERIRDAEPTEIEVLEALQRRASDVWEEYREQLAAHPDAIEVPLDAIRAGRVRVAIDGEGGIVGFSLVLPTQAGACELDGLFVDPDHMGGGVGRQLVADAASRAREAGADRIEVIANLRATGFYEKVGFRAGSEVPTSFGPAVRMQLDLSAARTPRRASRGGRA
jgi:GNAT superfamily N-acetyltransferase